MTSVKETGFIFCLLLIMVYSEEPEPVFRLEGDAIVMGYCFGVDYIVIYRSTSEGEQLLGNSSADAKYSLPPADLQGRVSFTSYQQLLGMQISDLRHSDAGVYRRECWQNEALVNQQRKRLSVCNQEIKSQEIAFMEDGGAELLCNSSSIGVEGATVRWYHDIFPSYKAMLLLDSSVSLMPLVEELQGVVEVREGGALLRVPNKVLQDSHHFFCVVMKGQNCLSFQIMYLPIRDDVEVIFASQGDRVVLKCLSRHKNQWWETPLGKINTTSKSLTSMDSSAKSYQMFVSDGDGAGNFSLMIPAVSDKHSGEYSCYSPSLTVQYSLFICPRREPQEILFYEGGDVLLECKVTEEEFSSLQWHRRGTSGEESLILDAKKKSLLVPEDLTGRVFPSEDGLALRLSGLTKKDRGIYWCVILGGPEFLDNDNYYTGDDEEVDGDEYNDVQDWPETYRCISKQETILTIAVNSNKEQGRGSGLKPDDPAQSPTQTRTPPHPPPADSNVTAYAMGAVIAGLVVAGAIAVIIIMKRRASASQKQRGVALEPGLKINKDIEMSEDPGCRERLASRNEYDD